MDSAVTKRCRVCGVDKPLAEMSRRKDRKDGYDTICLVCNRLRVKQWGSDNPEKKRAKDRRWETVHPEYRERQRREHVQRSRDRVRKWRLNNPEKARAKDQKWRRDNAEKERARKQRWFEENREKKRELDRQRRLAQPERVRGSRRKSEQANLEAGRIRKHRRRAKKKGNGGTFTVQEWQALQRKIPLSVLGLSSGRARDSAPSRSCDPYR